MELARGTLDAFAVLAFTARDSDHELVEPRRGRAIVALGNSN
jgi:hypothetical protein